MAIAPGSHSILSGSSREAIAAFRRSPLLAGLSLAMIALSLLVVGLFAVAAYNVGYGHIEDARILAQRAGKDEDRWEEVRKFLPLLSQGACRSGQRLRHRAA